MKFFNLFFLTLFSSLAFAQNLVEVEPRFDPSTSYKDRATELNHLFIFNQIQFKPGRYLSPSDGNSYSNLFGNTPINSAGFSYFIRKPLGPINFGLGAFIFSGSISDNLIGDRVQLSFTQTGLSIGVWLTHVFKQPWIVPFSTVHMSHISFKESDSLTEFKGITQSPLWYKYGVQFQINQIEPMVSNRANFELGLNNTFVEVFGIQSLGSQASQQSNDKPDFSPTLAWGLGLALEF